MSNLHRRLALLLAVALVAATSMWGSASQAQEGSGPDEPLPLIFVHGGFGSGQQFEAQALRFTSNGYPAEYLEMFEHNSLAYPGSQDEVHARLDTAIDDLLAATGHEQLWLAGHSQGTGVVQSYLADATRAGRVEAYVNLDGGSGGSVPDGVRTLAVWGEGDASRELPGATNVQFADQGHTEVVNSPETFAAMYEFLLGEAPTFTEVVREPADDIVVSGRVQLFPENTGAQNATLEIYEVDGTTGLRLGDPVATYPLSGEGNWGPVNVDGEAFYEFAVIRPDSGTHHIFTQRFVRSSRWVRILTGEPDGLADSFWEKSDDRQNIVIMRNTEWWGDQGDASDRLEINGQDVLTPEVSPRTNRTIGIFVHDAELDYLSDLSQPVSPSGVPFLTGIDLVLAAGDPAPGTTSVRSHPRKGDGPEGVCIPAYSSTNHRSSVQLNSYHQMLNPDGSPAEGQADPTCADAPPTLDPPAPTPTDPAAQAPGASAATPIAAAPGYTG